MLGPMVDVTSAESEIQIGNVSEKLWPSGMAGEQRTLALKRGPMFGQWSSTGGVPQLALAASRSVLLNGGCDREQVGLERTVLEIALAEGYVHNALLVRAELKLPRLELGDRLARVGRDSASFG